MVSVVVKFVVTVTVSLPAPPAMLTSPKMAEMLMLSLPEPPVIVAVVAEPMVAETPVPTAVLLPAFSVVTVPPNVPNAKAWSPETLTVVAAAVVKPVNVLAEPEEVMPTVSTPAKITVPAVTPLNVRATVSAVPATAAVVKPNVASCAVLETFNADATLPMLLNAAAAVLAEDSTVVTSVALSKLTVPAALKFALTVSMPFIEAALCVPVTPT